MKNSLFRMAKCTPNKPCIIFSKLTIAAFYIDSIDGFTAFSLIKNLLYGLWRSVNNGVFYFL